MTHFASSRELSRSERRRGAWRSGLFWAAISLSTTILGRAGAALHGQGATSVEDQLKAAASAERAGHYEQAAAFYRQALASPGLANLGEAAGVEVRTRLATDYFLLHRYQDSLDAVAPLTASGSVSIRAPAQAWLVDGLDRLELGQLSRAESSLRKTLIINPESGTARLALGDALARDGRMEDASRLYEEQIRQTPSEPDAWYKLGLAYAQLSTRVARDFGDKHIADPVGQRLAAEELLQEGDDIGAARSLFPLVRHTPVLSQVNADLGSALVRLGYFKAADDHFRAELADDPECPEAHLGLAETASLRGDWAAVQAELEALNNSHPRQLKQLLELPPPGTLRDELRRAKLNLPDRFTASSSGAMWKAWLEGADTVSTPPTGSSTGECPASVSKAETAPGVWLTDACYEALCRLLAGKRQINEREKLKLAEAEFRLGRYADARRDAQEVLESDLSSGWAAYWVSQSYGMLAQDCFAKVTSQNPNSARVHEMLAHYWTGRHYYARAKSEYVAAMKMAPELPDLHLGLATVELASNNWAEAESELKRTLQLAPGSMVAEYELGDAYLQQDRYDLAVQHLKQAIRDPAVGVKARIELADAESGAGQTEQAVKDLVAIAGQDRDGQVQYRLAKLYRKLGDKQRERDALSAFRRLQNASMQAGSGELPELEQERDVVQRHEDPAGVPRGPLSP